MVALALNSVAYNQAVLGVSAFGAGFANVDVQYSTRPDFKFALSPMVINVAPAGGTVTIAGLNQRTTYFVRVRERAGTIVKTWTKPLSFYTPSNIAQIVAPAGANKANAFISVPEFVTAWTTQQEIPGHPAANLATDNPNDQWWADYSAPGYAFEMQHSGAPVDTIALLETNAHAGMTITIKAGASLANVRGGAPSYSFGPQAFHASANLGGKPAYHALIRLPALQSFAFWRIEVAGTASLGRFVATYGIIGRARTAGKNMADDSGEISVDLGKLERTPEGSADRRRGYLRGRKVDFEIAMMSEAAWETQFADLRNILGSNESALVVPNSRANSFLHDRILYGPVVLRGSHPRSTVFTAGLSVSSQI